MKSKNTKNLHKSKKKLIRRKKSRNKRKKSGGAYDPRRYRSLRFSPHSRLYLPPVMIATM